jgi:hypothetical protein
MTGLGVGRTVLRIWERKSGLQTWYRIYLVFFVAYHTDLIKEMSSITPGKERLLYLLY